MQMHVSVHNREPKGMDKPFERIPHLVNSGILLVVRRQMAPFDLIHGGACSSCGGVGVAGMLLVAQARVDKPEISI